ncbi:MAG: hypothetical protein EHM48_00635 [Planctomycetaceae bacterium]|nr:MAG: hypothetical protein EHM48_00635 [Planctomycetaceae bacterium]
MAYGEPLPTDSASKKFLAPLADNSGANAFVAPAGANYRTQNGELVADQVVQLSSGDAASLSAIDTATAGTKTAADDAVTWLDSIDGRLQDSLPDLIKIGPGMLDLSGLKFFTSEGTYSEVAVENTAVGILAPMPSYYTDVVLILVENADVRMTLDGVTTPTSSVGHKVLRGTLLKLSRDEAISALFIRAGSDNAKLTITELSRKFDAACVIAFSHDVTISSAYADGDSLGVLRSSYPFGGDWELTQITVTDKNKQNAVIDVILFDVEPDSSTFTDKAAMAVHVDDLPGVFGKAHIAAADYLSLGATSVAQWNGSIVMRATSGNQMWFAFRCGSTPTFTDVDNYYFQFSFKRLGQ